MRSYLLLGCLGMTLAAGAEVLSPEAALQRAMAAKEVKAMKMSAVRPHLVFTQKAEAQPAAYVFNRGSDSGYIVVAADDEMAPVLGYSESGTVDVADMPDGLKYWLEYYAAEIEYARVNGVNASKAAPAKAVRAAISPLVATKWNQGSPYNDKCPLVNTTRTMTGCVATALAQVMKYHSWPATGTGANSYTWRNTTLSMDFSTVTFDWDNMLDTYTSSATDEQKDAVATLMSACGISVNMNYGTGASGAVARNCAAALVNYFNYDGSLRYLAREFFGLTEWENEVYNSLAAGCPVLYGGQSESGGHEFVCDGYSSNGYFHFNWGWGGMSDGYFKLTSLDPDSQGIGGAGGGAGYNFDQDVIVGIKPYAGQSAGLGVIYNMNDFTVTQTEAKLGAAINVSAQFYNGSSFAATGFVSGVAITDASGATMYVSSYNGRTYSLNAGSYYTSSMSYKVILPVTLADGEY
ncbi:MAG: C10 family peptidase, partial [Bacteroides sp.]|nr:C10 family peptidase [Bacteroides sp.]